jgi:tetratricopeptide (TPR) repeat protein
MEDAILAKPKEPDLYLTLAGLFEKEDQLRKALAVLQKGLEQNREDTNLHFQLGAIYNELGDFEEAVAQMKDVLRLRPDSADALNYLGYSYAERGNNLQEALEMIEKAMVLEPNNGYITDSLGWVYYKLGNYEKAATELEKANQLTPDDPTITEHLADVYFKLNQLQKALSFYQESLTLEPKPDQIERVNKKIKEVTGKKK